MIAWTLKRRKLLMRKFSKVSPVSRFSLFSIVIFAIMITLLYISKSSYAAADLINSTVSGAFREVMARLGGILPFSLYEIIMLSLPAVIIFVAVIAYRRFASGVLRLRFVISLASLLLLLLSGHILALGIAYNTTPVSVQMKLGEVEVTKERLSDIMISLRDEINELSEEISYVDGESHLPYTHGELSDKLCDSFDSLAADHGFIRSFDSRAKLVHFGNLMSYLGITGIYTYYTGEANVNSAYPDYDIVFTTAHELSHQRGILRENEANFVAYLVTSTSSDPYIRYGGALSMYEYISSALYRTDKELYKEINAGLSDRARSDVSASYEVTRKYGDTFIADISSFINDLFLKSNGTEGVVTYGRVVELTVAYYESKK